MWTNLLNLLTNLLQNLPKKKSPLTPPKMLMELLTPENIKSYFTTKDYKFFDTPNKKLNINIVGVRRDNQGSNTFDDFLLVMYREEELMVSHRWQATTDPGNIHRSNPYTESYVVNKWSAGCQVFKKVEDYEKFMDLCGESAKIYGNSFTYTLIDEKDLRKHLNS